MKRLLAALLVSVALVSGSQLLIACGNMSEVTFDQYIAANPNVNPATIVYNPTTGQYGAYWDAWHASTFPGYTQPAVITVTTPSTTSTSTTTNSSSTSYSTSQSTSVSVSVSPVLFEPPVPFSRQDPIADVIPQIDLVPVLGGDLVADMGIAAEVM